MWQLFRRSSSIAVALATLLASVSHGGRGGSCCLALAGESKSQRVSQTGLDDPAKSQQVSQMGPDDPAYWDGWYKVQAEHGRDRFEWYGLGFVELEATLSRLLEPGAEVLVVGSGDSDLSADLATKGWRVTSIDFSAQVVAHMRHRHPGLDFRTMDARNTTFETGHFQAVVDKGLSDCLATEEERRSYFQEMRRVLRAPGGQLVVISQRALQQPEDLGCGWTCEKRLEFLGPLFIEETATLPPREVPGTEGTIPYYFLACTSAGRTGGGEEEEEAAEACLSSRSKEEEEEESDAE